MGMPIRADDSAITDRGRSHQAPRDLRGRDHTSQSPTPRAHKAGYMDVPSKGLGVQYPDSRESFSVPAPTSTLPLRRFWRRWVLSLADDICTTVPHSSLQWNRSRNVTNVRPLGII